MWQQPATQGSPCIQEEMCLGDTSPNEVSNPDQVQFAGPGLDNRLCFMTSVCAPGCLGPLHSWLVHIRKETPEAGRDPFGEPSELLGWLMMCLLALPLFKPHSLMNT